MDEYTTGLINLNAENIELASNKHEIIKEAVNLLKDNKSTLGDVFLTEGIWAHNHILLNEIEITAFIVCEEYIFSEEAKKLLVQVMDKAKRIYVVSAKVFAKLTQLDGPDGFISICEYPNYQLSDISLNDNNIVVVLDGLETTGNIGTIIRTLDGSGCDAIIICNKRARVTNSKMIKAAMGAYFSKMMIDTDVHTLIQWLKDNNFKTILTDTRAEKNYYDLDYSGRIAIVAGNERYGISKTWYDEDAVLTKIPMLGKCDSLNVSVATSIIMYEAAMKQKGYRQ